MAKPEILFRIKADKKDEFISDLRGVGLRGNISRIQFVVDTLPTYLEDMDGKPMHQGLITLRLNQAGEISPSGRFTSFVENKLGKMNRFIQMIEDSSEIADLIDDLPHIPAAKAKAPNVHVDGISGKDSAADIVR